MNYIESNIVEPRSIEVTIFRDSVGLEHMKAFKLELNEVLDIGDTWDKIALHIGDLEYIDSSILGIFISLKKYTPNTIELVGVNERVRNIIKLSTLDKYFDWS